MLGGAGYEYTADKFQREKPKEAAEMAKKSSKDPKISGGEIHRRVLKRLDAYDKPSHLERFAMFLGKVQVLEFGLKSLLSRRYNYDPDKIERWTLGTTTHELEKCRLRSDHCAIENRGPLPQPCRA
jgi:hypothetical protein